MATSLIETQRESHYALEQYENALVQLLCVPEENYRLHRERLGAKHRASYLMDRIAERSSELRNVYKDDSGLRQNEIDTIANGGIGEFYDRLAKLKDYHRKFPENASRGDEDERVDFSGLTGPGFIDGQDFLDRMFTGEEFLGRYLDLVALHEQHSNLGHGIKRVNYLQYLDEFDLFEKIPRQAKNDKYAKYLQSLLDYLKSFYRRAFPLKDMDSELETVIADFNRRWDKGQIEGWTDNTAASTSQDAGIWCNACQRTYAKQTVFDAHLKSKNHLKKQAALEAGKSQNNGHADGAGHASTSSAPSMAVNEKARSMALMEHQIRYFVSDYDSPLLVIRNDTKSNVERKQALTDKERQIENEELEERERREAEEVALKSEKQAKKNFRMDDGDDAYNNGDDDEEERIYNPLKLPLGWDGKPIPFWLYKLHGLGVEYSCEICSNFTYRGRKNFERHFQEARHAFGMRALGLPNTKHFHEITKIADAVALAEKLKNEGRQEVVAQETMEEVEDEEGNVYNRKTYEDLKRQGLI